MFSAFAPVLATPLLKIPILVPDAVLTYINFTPPTPPPSEDERKKYSKDFVSDNFRIQMRVVNVCKTALIGLRAAEVTTILAQSFPSRLSDRLLSVLAPAGPLCLEPTPRFFIAGITALAAGLVRLWTYRTLGRFFRFQLSLVDGHRLITTGPYAWVRHPSYVASGLVAYANFVLLSGRGSYFIEAGLGRTALGKVITGAVAAYVLLTHAYMTLTRVNKEDAVLKEEFGEEWEEWARRTPYKLIPCVY